MDPAAAQEWRGSEVGYGGDGGDGAFAAGGLLSFTGSVWIFVALEPCNMRKGLEGLAGLVGTVMKEQLQSGALFVFGNRRRTRLKMLYFDGTGLWLLSKRLEEGTFSWPRDTEGKKTLRLRPEALATL